MSEWRERVDWYVKRDGLGDVSSGEYQAELERVAPIFASRPDGCLRAMLSGSIEGWLRGRRRQTLKPLA